MPVETPPLKQDRSQASRLFSAALIFLRFYTALYGSAFSPYFPIKNIDPRTSTRARALTHARPRVQRFGAAQYSHRESLVAYSKIH